jgi:hypothetical protein
MSTGSSSNIIIRLQNLPNEARAIDIVSLKKILIKIKKIFPSSDDFLPV